MVATQSRQATQPQQPYHPPRWVRRVCRLTMAAVLVYAASQAHAAHRELRELRDHQAGQSITMRQPAYQSSWVVDPGITVRVSTYVDDVGSRGGDPARVHMSRVQAALDAGMVPVAD